MSTAIFQKTIFGQFISLTKPRVITLVVFCAIIGMFMAAPGLPRADVVFFATLGIGLTAGSAAAVNCLIEQRIDAMMARTRWRPLPAGTLSSTQTITFAFIVGGCGLFILHRFVNPLTMWLTFATFVGYALIYTVLLKPNTPQNIVIGGASGAMPPVLGWTAVTGQIAPEALLMFLIIFVWTPPHFWSLALYRTQDYARAGLPMLPVTHGPHYTRVMILRYTVGLFGVTLLPYAIGMSGLLYLLCAVVLSGGFVWRAVQMYRNYSDALARSTFKYSIYYLAALFSALLLDHFLV